MNLLMECRFYGVRLSQVAELTGFTTSYVRQVLLRERHNEDITGLTIVALKNRKQELLNELLRESA